MGGADGEAAKIYADAFSRDKDFYAFYRRMEAYRQAFGAGRRDHGPEPRQRLLPLLQRSSRAAGAQEVALRQGAAKTVTGRRLLQSCHAAGSFCAQALRKL